MGRRDRDPFDGNPREQHPAGKARRFKTGETIDEAAAKFAKALVEGGVGYFPDYDVWLDYGLMMGFCTPPACDMHEGTPLTEEEMQQLDDGDDPCIPVVRVFPLGKPHDLIYPEPFIEDDDE